MIVHDQLLFRVDAQGEEESHTFYVLADSVVEAVLKAEAHCDENLGGAAVIGVCIADGPLVEGSLDESDEDAVFPVVGEAASKKEAPVSGDRN